MAGTYADSEQAAVLDAVVAILINQIPALSDKNCFLSILEDPPQMPTDSIFLTVAPSAGKFPPEFIEGGGQNQCTEETGVVVSVFSQFQASRAGHDRAILNDTSRGILRMKRLVLKALTAQNLTSTDDANLVLRSLMVPKTSSYPAFVKDEQLVKVAIEFEILFDWNLTR